MVPSVRIICSAGVVPVQDVFAQFGIPVAAAGDTGAGLKPVGEREGEERGVRVAGVARPPPTSICSAVAELRMMKSFDGGSTDRPEKRLTARSKVPHQALTGATVPGRGREARRAPTPRGSRPRSTSRHGPRQRPRVRSLRRGAWSRVYPAGFGLTWTGPTRSSTAVSSSRVTSATGRSGPSGTRWARPSLCSATA